MPHPAAYNVQYIQRLLALNPIALWALNEKTGTVAWDASRNGRHGTHSNVTLGQPGIGDGETSCLYDGVTSYTNVFSPSFRDAFNGLEGTVACWVRVANAGTWTDGVWRRVLFFTTGANNIIYIAKSSNNDQVWFVYHAGGVTKTQIISTSDLDYLILAMTWSKTRDEVRIFVNGTQYGATQNGLGNWAGSLLSAGTNLGSTDTTPTNVWHGNISFVVPFNYALSPAIIADFVRIQ